MVENYRPHFWFTWRENWGIAYTCTQVSAAILLCCLAVSIPGNFSEYQDHLSQKVQGDFTHKTACRIQSGHQLTTQFWSDHEEQWQGKEARLSSQGTHSSTYSPLHKWSVWGFKMHLRQLFCIKDWFFVHKTTHPEITRISFENKI
jgi:hypothetical protein